MTKGDTGVVQLHGIVGERGAVVRGTTPFVELANGSVEDLSCVIAVGKQVSVRNPSSFSYIHSSLASRTVTPCSCACRLGTSTRPHVCLCQQIFMGTR